MATESVTINAKKENIVYAVPEKYIATGLGLPKEIRE